MHAMTRPADVSDLPENELLNEILSRRRRHLPKLTIALTVVLVVGLAFVVGAEVQKRYGTATSSSSSSTGTAAAAFARARASGGLPSFGGGGSAPAGAFGAAGSGTSGTVTLIKGSSLYVTDSSGNTVLVKTAAGSRVTKTVTSSVKRILPGAVVTVVGTKAKDGSYTATSISVSNGG
jgi:hypothetical protein